MKRPLIVIGTNGLAREIALTARHINAERPCWDFVGFIGENGCDAGKDLGHGPVLGDDQWLLSQEMEADIIIGIGHPQIRERVLQPYLTQGNRFRYPNLIHPSALVDLQWVTMGQGNIITAGCIFTCDILIGNFNLFNLNTTVGHDTRIGSFNVLNPGVNVSGGVSMGDRILAGTGSQVLENLTIDSDTRIGAGAVVVRDISGGGITVVGVPAKPLQKAFG